VTLCFATNNVHKIEEVKALLPSDFTLLTLDQIGCVEELAEDQTTLEGNSLQKAEYVFKKFGVPCIADDTGLEVFALDGDPGVYSARYAGPAADSRDNITLLLKNMEDIKERQAQFRTVITLVTEKKTRQFEGVITGHILRETSGKGGFGYDPVFIPKGDDRTFSDMTAQEKNRISHRGQAIKKLVDYLVTHQEKLI
jgi:XTP/dITP diphosphohydrolase